MPVKPSEEEEKYVRAEEARKLKKLKGEAMVAKESSAQGAEIAKAVGSSNPEIGAKLMALGFEPETAKVLYFVPLIEVAWADGKIGYEESVKVVDRARKSGIRATTAAYDFLSNLTLNRPEAAWFDGCTEVIGLLLAEMPSEKREAEIVSLSDLMVEVARASAGFFGFGADVSEEERVAIKGIVQELGLENSARSVEILKKL